jgi:hypothetical protein
MTDIRIDRLELALHGVAPELAEAALDGLDAELARRLGAHGVGDAAWRARLPSIRLDPLDASGLDAASLRAGIAERLVALLARELR